MKKKCIVVDLDNTLWGGVAGEDGKDGIALSLVPPGNSFMAFQQALLDLHHLGIILAINSRNNAEDALDIIRNHPNMILKENHFAAMRINWNDKAQNLKELAEELNIGLDSMVFLDDEPTNRALVRSFVPEVETPDLPANPSQYARFLNSLNYFSSQVTTDEDKMRGNFYVTERLRREAEKQFATREDFLRDLSLELVMYENDKSCIPRLSQLTEKTNQFNVLKRPFTEAEVLSYIEHPEYSVFHATLQDKFGNYGIIAFALVRKKETQWHIQSLLMSCRVLGRDVEKSFVGTIANEGKKRGAKKITVTIEETPKNLPALKFIEAHFHNREHNTSKMFPIPDWITITYEKIQ